MSRTTQWILTVSCLLFGQDAPTIAAEPATKTSAPLASLPSKPGSHVERIKAMGDNAWLYLGAPTADPRWGKALGRAYSPRMVYLPKQEAAFLAGQGPHGGMKPGGIYQDEIFAYDINAHRWICLYPGSDINRLTLKLDKNGFEVDEQGEHVPVAILGHGYSHLTYDSVQDKVAIIPIGNTWWPGVFPRRNDWLDDKARSLLRNPSHPWFYDPQTGRFEHRFVSGPGPGEAVFHGVVEYVPSKRQIFLLHKGCRAFFYDPAANSWAAAKAPPGPLKGYDWAGCFDAARNRVYVGKGRDFAAYDVPSDAWLHCAAPPVSIGHSSQQTLTFDAASGVVIMLTHRKGSPTESQGVHVYSPADDKWETCPLPDMFPNGNVNAFYDPELNAHFFHVAGDGKPDGVMCVYRHRRPGASEAKEIVP